MLRFERLRPQAGIRAASLTLAEAGKVESLKQTESPSTRILNCGKQNLNLGIEKYKVLNQIDIIDFLDEVNQKDSQLLRLRLPVQGLSLYESAGR
jgi:hypothetical protein